MSIMAALSPDPLSSCLCHSLVPGCMLTSRRGDSISRCPHWSRKTPPAPSANVPDLHFSKMEPFHWNSLALCLNKAPVYRLLGHNMRQ